MTTLKNPSKEFILNDLEELEQVASQLLADTNSSKVYTLTGDLGAGKTTLTQAVCRQLGVQENVTSPTFSLVNEYSYRDKNGEEKLFRHLDLYRLKNIEEALDIGIEDMLFDDHFCFIEWPEIIAPILPDDTIKINISIIGDSSRKILIL